MNSRKMYFDQLLFDALDSAVGLDLGEDSIIIAALILSDSINGLRKALLQAASTKTAEAV
jgi:hypothetical protein